MADVALITVQALGAVSAGSGTGAAVDLGASRTAAKLVHRVTACAGTLTTTLETSADGTTGWRTAKQLDATTVPVVNRYAVDDLDRWVRATWNAGTSATFGLDGEAHQLYADVHDLRDKLAASVLDAVEQLDDSHGPNLRARVLISASSEMESALAVQHPMPLAAVPEIVRDKTADIAAQRILDRVGHIGGGVDEVIARAYDEALAWMDAMRRRSGPMPFGAAPAPAAPVRITTSTTPRICSTRRSFWSRDEDC